MSVAVVERSLPVLFFGDALQAQIATISNNPSPHEYDPSKDRLAKTNLGETRQEYARRNAGYALTRMEHYFHWDPYKIWFTRPANLIRGMGACYKDGDAVHMDLVTEPTASTTGKLGALWPRLVELEQPLLTWMLDEFDIRLLLFDGTAIINQAHWLSTRVETRASGNAGRRNWTVGIGRLETRDVGIAWWSDELNSRRTGCSLADAQMLGKEIREAVVNLKIRLPDCFV